MSGRGDFVALPAWLERAAPSELSILLTKEAGPRKVGLFVRHLLRCFPEVFTDPRSRAALDAGDRYADGELGGDEFRAALRAADEATAEARTRYDAWAPSFGDADRPAWAAAAATSVARQAAEGFSPGQLSDLRRAVLDRAGGGGPRKNPIARAMRPIFSEHFGDPRKPVAVDPDWRTSTVLALAGAVYADRAWDRLPVLADALDDAGCTDPDLLGHLRGPGPHARGCWVVDLLLGKT